MSDNKKKKSKKLKKENKKLRKEINDLRKMVDIFLKNYYVLNCLSLTTFRGFGYYYEDG